MKEEFEQIANHLRTLYQENFAGKTKGRFFLSKDQLKFLSNRQALQKSTEDAIFSAALKLHSLSIVRVEGGYGVIEQNKPQKWRPVPTKLLTKLVG